MDNKIKAFFLGGNHQNSLSQNFGFLILRFFVGLALCTFFEKFFPKSGSFKILPIWVFSFQPSLLSWQCHGVGLSPHQRTD